METTKNIGLENGYQFTSHFLETNNECASGRVKVRVERRTDTSSDGAIWMALCAVDAEENLDTIGLSLTREEAVYLVDAMMSSLCEFDDAANQ